jgi:hypothetical protein
MTSPRPADAGPAPRALLLQLTTAVWAAQALWAAARLGIADELAAGPRTREELAAASGTLPGPLYRVLRALAGLGIFQELPDGRIANSPASELLRSGVPGSIRDYVIFVGEPWHLAAHGEILHALRTGETSVDRVVGKNIWEFFASDEEAGRRFHAGMSSLIGGEAALVRDGYDFSGVRTLVDVGGGHGALLGTILAGHPAVGGVLFDRPAVVDGARDTFARLGVGERVRIEGGDFFQAVPRGDAYLLSHILHDWDDERAIAILRTIRRAAEPGARVLLVESVIPPGNDFHVGKLLDLEMLLLPGGVERTEAEYAGLLGAGGFRLRRVLPLPSPSSIVEAVVET